MSVPEDDCHVPMTKKSCQIYILCNHLVKYPAIRSVATNENKVGVSGYVYALSKQ